MDNRGKITKIRIAGLRCIRTVEIEPPEGLTVLLGDAGTGKRTVLEALEALGKAGRNAEVPAGERPRTGEPPDWRTNDVEGRTPDDCEAGCARIEAAGAAPAAGGLDVRHWRYSAVIGPGSGGLTAEEVVAGTRRGNDVTATGRWAAEPGPNGTIVPGTALRPGTLSEDDDAAAAARGTGRRMLARIRYVDPERIAGAAAAGGLEEPPGGSLEARLLAMRGTEDGEALGEWLREYTDERLKWIGKADGTAAAGRALFSERGKPRTLGELSRGTRVFAAVCAELFRNAADTSLLALRMPDAGTAAGKGHLVIDAVRRIAETRAAPVLMTIARPDSLNWLHDSELDASWILLPEERGEGCAARGTTACRLGEIADFRRVRGRKLPGCLYTEGWLRMSAENALEKAHEKATAAA